MSKLMPKPTIQFSPSTRLPEQLMSGIQNMIKHADDAVIPETPNNSMIFTSHLKDKLIGYASVTIEKKAAKVTSLFIEKSQRNKLFGFRLMIDILEKLSITACEKIYLACPETILPLFKALGFMVTKELRQIPLHQQQKYLELENPCPSFFLKTLRQTLKTEDINLNIGA